MRQTEASGWIVRNSSNVATRVLRLAVIPLGMALAVSAGSARAEDDNRTFSEKFMDGFYNTIRGSNMDNRGIDYRERSPLVVPPTLDLPPPTAAAQNTQIANWPKDPDERQRKAVIEAKKKNAPPPVRVQAAATQTAAGPARPVNIAPPPDEPPAPGTTRPTYANDNNGTARIDPVYDQPGDLFTGGLSRSLGLGDSLDIGNLFGTKKTELVVQPGSEPTREALTQPPAGYQTPSPNYPYAPEQKGLLSGESNPDRNPLAQRSSATSMAK